MKVVLDNIRSAENVGSILRTCDAMGIKEVYFCGLTPEPDHPKVNITALGAEKSIRPHTNKSTYDTVNKLGNKGDYIAALELDPMAKPINDFKPTKNLVLVVGNEVSGIAEDVLGICDTVLEIPMQGTKESLNVAVAFGIAAFTLTDLE